MDIVGIRDLSRRTRELVEQVELTGQPILVTRRGRPAVVLYRLPQDELEDLVLANAPEFVRSMADADRNLAEGTAVDWDSVREKYLSEEGAPSEKPAARRPRRARPA
jgi:prevent-host-death family protein